MSVVVKPQHSDGTEALWSALSCFFTQRKNNKDSVIIQQSKYETSLAPPESFVALFYAHKHQIMTANCNILSGFERAALTKEAHVSFLVRPCFFFSYILAEYFVNISKTALDHTHYRKTETTERFLFLYNQKMGHDVV